MSENHPIKDYVSQLFFSNIFTRNADALNNFNKHLQALRDAQGEETCSSTKSLGPIYHPTKEDREPCAH
ncbi:hypothetical protein Pla110_44550 [Polystyrenella longa]|uniref:Uncharacterized protein n=1 Tax=Polystyrenella longa TaxID=2528007 RepID=A0A518CU32_9PLAN|nr:hypothetical protein Pla110_44550 [Polystyrenella longa]